MNTQAEWRAQGEALAKAHKAQQWAIADWLVSGVVLLHPELADIEPHKLEWPEHRHKTAAYDIAMELFPDYTRETLRQFAHVARAYPPLTRVNANLSFGHYRAALAAPEATRGEWLSKASAAGWSVATLRLAIAEVEYRQKNLEIEIPDGSEAAGTEGAPAPPIKSVKPIPRAEFHLPYLPVKTHAKFEKLARIQNIAPEILLVRIVESYLEEQADLLAVAEQREVDDWLKQYPEPTPAPVDAAWAKEQAAKQRELSKAQQAEWERQRHEEDLAKAEAAAEEAARRAAEWAQQQREDAPYAKVRQIHAALEEAIKAADQAQAAALAPAPAETVEELEEITA